MPTRLGKQTIVASMCNHSQIPNWPWHLRGNSLVLDLCSLCSFEGAFQGNCIFGMKTVLPFQLETFEKWVSHGGGDRTAASLTRHQKVGGLLLA